VGGDLLTLSMIVKDEVKTLGRTLASAKPYIDRWVILDTGSTDGTQDLVRRALEGVPGELHEEPFVDFATTRNRALDLAGTATEFVMWMDADDGLEGGAALRAFLDAERAAHGPDREAYFVRVEMGVRFDSPRVLRARDGWRFRGVVHEILMRADRGPPVHRVPDVILHHEPGEESAERSRSRWERDAALLEAAVARDPSDARAAFYLAETYLWLQRYEAAEAAFERRIALGGWAEEVFESKQGLARAAAGRGAPWAEVQARWLDAHAFAPHRAEPLYAIAVHYDALGQHALTFLFARRGAEAPSPVQDTLFVDEDVYTWRLADLVGSSAFWLGEFEIGEAAARKAAGARPDDERLARNLAYYVARDKSQPKR
jgi:tetratricopeptide (TPR) repeat protein